jgi:8-oxo-dGTP diphosphatase
MSVVHASLAVIINENNQILITRRAHDVPHGGLWEVPGGKLEPEETPHEALLREIHEEVGLLIKKANLLGEVRHAYPEKEVCLHVFHVLEYTGDAQCHDGQLDLRWVSRDAFQTFDFPEAMPAVFELI